MNIVKRNIWLLNNETYIVASDMEEAFEIFHKHLGKDIKSVNFIDEALIDEII